MTNKADILVVDDEVDIRELVAGILEDEGYSTRRAGSADEALAAIRARRPTLVFLDIWLQGSKLDGLQVLDLIKEGDPELPVVMIRATATSRRRSPPSAGAPTTSSRNPSNPTACCWSPSGRWSPSA